MKINKQSFKNPVFWAFFLSLAYWLSLVLTSHMEISCDAVGYESLGKTLAGKGWLDYFLNGPAREPLYPLIVSISMRIAAFFSFPYQSIQTFFQLCILFIAQLLMLRILRLLRMNNWISAFTVFYLGVSPVIVNSALSLFSEIATYPLILAIILFMFKTWVSLSGPKSRIIIFSIASGLLLVLITLTKGIFEVIVPVFIGLFFLSALFTHNRRLILNALMSVAFVLVVFYSLITGYKLTNKVFNGNFVITNRGSVMFYGGVARRAEPLTGKRFFSCLAYLPGEGVCEAIFGKEECSFWSNPKSDEFGFKKVGELTAKGLRPEEIDREITRAALGKVLQNPAQSFLLWFMEGLKMAFWESTQVGFVAYPAGLSALFSWPPIKNGLRLLMACWTFAALIYLVNYLLRLNRSVFEPQENTGILLFFITIFIFLFTSVHALCSILIRYSFPIVPLYLIIIAFFTQKMVFRRNV